jgi:hypothetical protein
VCGNVTRAVRSLNVEQEQADIREVRLATASIGLLTTAVLMLVVRGPSDWSSAFGLSWYGLFAAAVGLALAALVAAALSRELALKRRLAIIGLSLPALLAAPVLLWAVVTLAPLAD